jgi:hypothetical protein
MNEHLSRAQISEWILGKQTLEEERHVRQCRECSKELAQCRSALEAFGQSVRGWAQLQKASTPPDPETWLSANRGLRARPWNLAVGVAAALAIAAGIPTYRGVMEAERQALLEQEDAQLLEQVDTQLSRVAPMSMEPLSELMQEEGKETSQ